jgi:hypothetical protein
MKNPELLVMRLCDMGRIHPQQDNSHKCSRCGFQVGIYPSGQEHIKKHPNIRIVCTICADAGPPDTFTLGVPPDNIIAEMRESVPATTVKMVPPQYKKGGFHGDK